MKTRYGFVSNSSSTSFLIVYKQEKLDELPAYCLNLDRMVENYGDEVSRDVGEIVEKLERAKEWMHDPSIYDALIKKVRELDGKGYCILALDADYHSMLEDYLRGLSEEGVIKILMEES